MIRLRLLAIVLCLSALVKAQEPGFHHHELGDLYAGISHNTLYQDKNAMLWIGTDDGLARYDGNNFFLIPIDTLFIQPEVTALFEDDKGFLWVGTSQGKIFYLDQTRKAFHFDVEEGHPAKRITAIEQDPQGQIWFATYGEGVYVYTGSRMFNLAEDDGLSANDIYDMTLSPSGEVWLGTDDGINVCSFVKEKKSIRVLGLEEGLPDQIITAVEADNHGNVWIGTFESGVVYYNASLHKVLRPFDDEGLDEITSFEIFDGREIWIGTKKSGAWRYNPQTGINRKVISLAALSQGEITDILTDVEGNVWIAMDDGSLLSAYRPFEIIHVDVDEIQTLFSDHSNNLWIGSKKGLYRLEAHATLPSELKRIYPDHDWNITDILEDKYHNLWIGTLDKGLFVLDLKSGGIWNAGKALLPDENAIMSMDMTEDKIWIATLQGVVSYPAQKNILTDKNVSFELVNDPWKSSLHFVFQVFVDSKDRAWFATDGNGVYCIDKDSVKLILGTDSLDLSTVYSICEDHRGHLWFFVPTIGLVEFDGYNYKPLTLAEGLGNMAITSIASAGTTDLVIAHQRGIDLMEPDRRHFMYYNDEIGIKEFQGTLNAITTDSWGHVYISGKDKIVKFYATQHELSIHPRTQITRVSVFDQPVDFTVKQSFPYDENYISFDYVGLWYSSPESVNYQYKLEGYDLQWKESRDNVASYSSLPPGDYTFFVRASENKFFLDEPMTSYSFTIAKPFWFQAWFVILIVVFSAGLVYWFIKMRERRFKRQATLKKEMVENQLQVLKAQINPHFLFNSFNTLITIIDENSRKPAVAIEYVEKLSDFFRSILQYREAESISLEEEWELVQNFGYLLSKRYGSNLRLHMDVPPKDACIIPLTLQMLVENAVKHNVISEHKPLDVFITTDEEYIIVRNNLQPKSKTEPSTKFGLQSIISRYHLLGNQKVIIHKDNDFFEVRIPIIKKESE